MMFGIMTDKSANNGSNIVYFIHIYSVGNLERISELGNMHIGYGYAFYTNKADC